jgi:hypothetical protein
LRVIRPESHQTMVEIWKWVWVWTGFAVRVPVMVPTVPVTEAPGPVVSRWPRSMTDTILRAGLNYQFH